MIIEIKQPNMVLYPENQLKTCAKRVTMTEMGRRNMI